MKEKPAQIRLNITRRQAFLLNQAIEKGIMSNLSEGVRSAIDKYLDRLIATHKIKEQ